MAPTEGSDRSSGKLKAQTKPKGNMEKVLKASRKREELIRRAPLAEAVKIKKEYIAQGDRNRTDGNKEHPVVIEEEEQQETPNEKRTRSNDPGLLEKGGGPLPRKKDSPKAPTKDKSLATSQGREDATPTKTSPRVNFMVEFDQEIDEEVEKRHAAKKGDPQQAKDDGHTMEPIGQPRRSSRLRSVSQPAATNEQTQTQHSLNNTSRGSRVNHPKTNPAKARDKGEEGSSEHHGHRDTSTGGNSDGNDPQPKAPKEGRQTTQNADEAQQEDTDLRLGRKVKGQGGENTEIRQTIAPEKETEDKESPKKTMREALMTEPAVIRRKHSFRVQFTFATDGAPNADVPFASKQSRHLQRAIREFLNNIQAIDSTAVINTWNSTKCLQKQAILRGINLE